VTRNGDIRAIGLHGAGIGAGFGNGSGQWTVSAIVIENGNFYCQALGAGGYAWHNLSKPYVSSVTIMNGAFDLYGSFGAGLGSGCGFAGQSIVDTITVRNGSLNAYGFHGARIGTGHRDSGNSSIRTLTLADGEFRAIGGD
jgi:hypothetical protein